MWPCGEPIFASMSGGVSTCMPMMPSEKPGACSSITRMTLRTSSSLRVVQSPSFSVWGAWPPKRWTTCLPGGAMLSSTKLGVTGVMKGSRDMSPYLASS